MFKDQLLEWAEILAESVYDDASKASQAALDHSSNDDPPDIKHHDVGAKLHSVARHAAEKAHEHAVKTGDRVAVKKFKSLSSLHGGYHERHTRDRDEIVND